MMIPVLIGVSFVIFSMLYFAPGDAADFILGDMATVADKQQFRVQCERARQGGAFEHAAAQL